MSSTTRQLGSKKLVLSGRKSRAIKRRTGSLMKADEGEGVVKGKNSRGLSLKRRSSKDTLASNTPSLDSIGDIDASIDNSDRSQFDKDEFRDYLTKSGFKGGLSRALVALYEEPDEEKPDNPLDWILGLWGHGIPKEFDKHRAEVAELGEKIDQLQKEQKDLQQRILEKELESKEWEHQRLSKKLQQMLDELLEEGEYKLRNDDEEEEEDEDECDCACFF